MPSGALEAVAQLNPAYAAGVEAAFLSAMDTTPLRPLRLVLCRPRHGVSASECTAQQDKRLTL